MPRKPKRKAKPQLNGHASNKQRVIDYIRAAGVAGTCCEDWERDLKLSHQTASALLAELTNAGIIIATGERKRTKAGGTGRVVILSDFRGQPRPGTFF